jgi:hypothetical protein
MMNASIVLRLDIFINQKHVSESSIHVVSVEEGRCNILLAGWPGLTLTTGAVIEALSNGCTEN